MTEVQLTSEETPNEKFRSKTKCIEFESTFEKEKRKKLRVNAFVIESVNVICNRYTWNDLTKCTWNEVQHQQQQQ